MKILVLLSFILSCFVIKILNANDLKSEYFTLAQGCDWGRLNDFGTKCSGDNDGGGDSFSYYKLKKPLHLSGEFVLHTEYPSECGDPEIAVKFLAYKKGFEFLEYSRLSMDKKSMQKMESMLPEWFLSGLLGEVTFRVSFDVENRKALIDFQGDNEKVQTHSDLIGFVEENHACGMGHTDRIHVKNVKMTKIAETLSNRKDYENEMMLALKSYNILGNNDISLYKMPNGEILTSIPVAKKDEILIVGIEDRSISWRWLVDNAKSPNATNKETNKQELQTQMQETNMQQQNKKEMQKTQWIRVLYFPPGVTTTKNAKIGYINAKQIELKGF